MKTKPWTAPIVDEVHATRKKIAQEAGYDLKVSVKRLQDSQKARGDRLVSRAPQRVDE